MRVKSCCRFSALNRNYKNINTSLSTKTNIPITLDTSAVNTSIGGLSLFKNGLGMIEYSVVLYLTTTLSSTSSTIIGTYDNAIYNLNNLTIPCFLSQQGDAKSVGVIWFDSGNMTIQSSNDYSFLPDASYAILCYAQNYI